MSTIEPTCVLIADISGYTGYLAGVELDHAQDILADLMGTVVSALRPTFRLSKLEGDAAFVFAPLARLDGTILLDTIERCYFGFRRRRRDVRQATSCECSACTRIPDLDLKFIAHAGSVARQKMAGREELVGSPVIVVHRLLKNSVPEATGIPAYALVSQQVADDLGLEPEALGMRRHVEAYEHIGEVVGWVEDLEARWAEEDARRRVLVGPDDAMLTTETVTEAPPQLAWEFMTKPGRRVAWAVGVTDVIEKGKGGRRTVGGTNHCMHGKDAIIEDILDWRPYDYFTIRSTIATPAGPVAFPATTEFEPTAAGTIVRTRFGKPATEAELQVLGQMREMFEAMMDAGVKVLRGQLADECGRIAEEVADEPELPEPTGAVTAAVPAAPSATTVRA